MAQLNGIISVTLPYWLQVIGWYVLPGTSRPRVSPDTRNLAGQPR